MGRTTCLAAVTAALLLPAAALACPVCYDAGSPGGLRSYYFSTLMLSLLPFAIVGVIAAVGYVLSGRSRAIEDTPPAVTTG